MDRKVKRSRELQFWYVFGTQTAALIGAGAASISLALWVYSQTGSAFDLASLTAARFMVAVAFAPFAGVIGDKMGRRRAVLIADWGLVALASITFVLLTCQVQLVAVYFVTTMLTGALDSVVSVSLAASVRQLRRDADLTRVNALLAVLESSPLVLAPALGATIYSVAGAASAFLLSALTFGGALVGVASARLDIPASGSNSAPFEGASAGWRFIWGHRGFRELQLGMAAHNVLGALGTGMVTAYILDSSGGSSAALGAANSAGGLGSVFGATIVFWLARRLRRVSVVTSGVVVGAAVGRILFGLGPSLVYWMIGMAGRSMGVQAINAPLTAAWQERTPVHLQGRVFGARRLIGQGPIPVAILIGGWLADVLMNGQFGISDFWPWLGAHSALVPAFVFLGVAELMIVPLVLRRASVRALLQQQTSDENAESFA